MVGLDSYAHQRAIGTTSMGPLWASASTRILAAAVTLWPSEIDSSRINLSAKNSDAAKKRGVGTAFGNSNAMQILCTAVTVTG
jgi:hypothetical protein